MNRETISKSAQEKARYASATLRRLGRLKKRRYEAESDLINALAIDRHCNRDSLRRLVVDFDDKYVIAEGRLENLRKASALDWYSMRDLMDDSVTQLSSMVNKIESRTAAIEKSQES